MDIIDFIETVFASVDSEVSLITYTSNDNTGITGCDIDDIVKTQIVKSTSDIIFVVSMFGTANIIFIATKK